MNYFNLFTLFQNYWAGPNTTVPPPSELYQWNKLNVISKVDDRTHDPSFIGKYDLILLYY